MKRPKVREFEGMAWYNVEEADFYIRHLEMLLSGIRDNLEEMVENLDDDLDDTEDE